MTAVTLNRDLRDLKRRAASANWVVREGAGFALRDLMEIDFDAIFRATQGWVTDEDDRVRRAACLACMHRKRFGTPTRIRRILGRMLVLMRDESRYVQRACGPFVLGYLTYTYPVITIPFLRKAARARNPWVRVNVARAFSQAAGGRESSAAIELLEVLADDNDPRVVRAVGVAARNLRRRGIISRSRKLARMAG
jgi:HEAT repeat protein